MYILSGSQNFLMHRGVSQSLPGRAAVLTLLPFSLNERRTGGFPPECAAQWLYQGGYPRLHMDSIDPADYFPSYIETYVERDIRAETNIHDLARFGAFLRVCASRVGTPINLTDLGKAVSADARTVQSWLAVLEESYIVFRLPPWYRNVGKRQTKSAKLYFHDTGLLCSLLGFRDAGALKTHSLRGYVFENAVIGELAKRRYHAGQSPPFYFWRDSNSMDKEVDLVIEQADALDLLEIKSSQTAIAKHAKNLNAFAESCGLESAKTVVYDGPDGLRLSGVPFVNWREM